MGFSVHLVYSVRHMVKSPLPYFFYIDQVKSNQFDAVIVNNLPIQASVFLFILPTALVSYLKCKE